MSCWSVNSFHFSLEKLHPCWSTRAVFHYGDIIMSVIASQITSLTIVYSTVYSRRTGPLFGEFTSNAENVSIWWHHVSRKIKRINRPTRHVLLHDHALNPLHVMVWYISHSFNLQHFSPLPHIMWWLNTSSIYYYGRLAQIKAKYTQQIGGIFSCVPVVHQNSSLVLSKHDKLVCG